MRSWVFLGLFAVTGTAAARDIYQEPTAADVPALVAALRDPNLRQGAAAALAKVGKPAVPALQKALDDKESPLRLWAAYSLGGIGPDASEAVPGLCGAIKNGDATLRAVAVEALGKIGPEAHEAVPVLVASLKDNEPRVRNWAATALAKIRPENPEASRALVAALKDEPVRLVAADALVRIGQPAVPVLVESLRDDDVRFDVTLVLRQVDARAAAEAGVAKTTAADLVTLTRALQNKTRNPPCRRAAAAALVELGKAAAPAIPALTSVLGDDEVRDSAIPVLVGIGKPAVPALIAGLEGESPRAREGAAVALGQVGPDAREAVPALLAALKDRDAYVRRAACLSLGQIDPDA